MPTTTPKRGRGRPPADPSGTGKRVTVSLSPAEIAWLESKYGSAYAGLRELVRRDVVGPRPRKPIIT